MKKQFFAVCLAASALLAAPASATLIEFDVGGLLMEDVMGLSGLYTPEGTFEFDTDSELVSNVNVISIHNTYFTGAYDSDTFGLFASFSDPLGVVLNINFDFTQLLNEIAGLNVGDSFFMGADPMENDNDTGDLYGVGIDPTLVGTILQDSGPGPSPVPLPAGFPLMLAALGGLGYLRRKQKR